MSNLDLPIASLSQFQVSEIMSNLTILSTFSCIHLSSYSSKGVDGNWLKRGKEDPKEGTPTGGLTDLLCTFGGGMWERWKGCPSSGVDGSTGRWKTMGNIMTILGCWGLKLAPLDFPLMVPGTQLRLITLRWFSIPGGQLLRATSRSSGPKPIVAWTGRKARWRSITQESLQL